MTAFVLIPGAGGDAWYWHRVVPLLHSAGHEAIAVDLPGPDPSAGLAEYEALVGEALGGRPDAVLVAQSLGAFTAARVAARSPVRALVLVNAMVPEPGETPGDWWAHTGWEQACAAAADAGGYGRAFDPAVYFTHDVPPDVLASGGQEARGEADVVFGSVCDIAAWPSVPTRVLSGRDDRFFPLELQRRVARERLGVEVDAVPGGHLVALARPEVVVSYLGSV